MQQSVVRRSRRDVFRLQQGSPRPSKRGVYVSDYVPFICQHRIVSGVTMVEGRPKQVVFIPIYHDSLEAGLVDAAWDLLEQYEQLLAETPRLHLLI